MRKIKWLIFVLCPYLAFSQSNYTWDGKNLSLSNGSISRVISVSNDSVYSVKLSLNDSPKKFLQDRSPEFQFTVNDKLLNGYSGWDLLSCSPISDSLGGKGARIRMTGGDPAAIQLDVCYLLYPGLPVIRKWLVIKNSSQAELKVESLDVEKLILNIDYISTWVYHDYARMKQIGPFTGNWYDPLVVVHNTTDRAGIALGNESPGVLKRTAFHTENCNVDIGLTHAGQDFPFRKWLKPDESWTSPKTFIALYSNTDDGFNVVNTTVNDFVRRHMGTRLSVMKCKPVFVYNTWYPFRVFVTDPLVRELAKSAAECGIQEFVIDDGWQYNEDRKSADLAWGTNYGDWLTDRTKFPDDLSATFRLIRSQGMKPGLWISIGSANSTSKVGREHPEWFVRDNRGNIGNLHYSSEGSPFYTSCFGTEWCNYIKEKILNLVREYGLAYAKLDLSIITSAYINNPAVSGCYAADHPFHRDHEESFIVLYENVLKLFDDLHAEAPELFIDCTFETAGKLQLQDYAFAQHAEGNWLSNIEEPFPTGALRARQLAWWRSPVLPAGSLVIGNLPLDSKNLDFDLKSLLGSLLIELGDPRKLSPEQKAAIKKWSDWMLKAEEKYNYMIYRQDLPGFGEPAEGSWDGWSRINNDTKEGGIIGVFRQNAAENSRNVFIENLLPDKKYAVLRAPDREKLAELTGDQLAHQGFVVNMKADYEGQIYEIQIVK